MKKISNKILIGLISLYIITYIVITLFAVKQAKRGLTEQENVSEHSMQESAEIEKETLAFTF